MSWNDIPENPLITIMERDGLPDFLPDPVCPECGKVCETIYKRKIGVAIYEILGCENCIEDVQAWECDECFEN